MDAAEMLLTSALDQGWAACVDAYDALTPAERDELASRILGEGDGLDHLPEWMRRQIETLATTAFIEAGTRWARRREAEAKGT